MQSMSGRQASDCAAASRRSLPVAFLLPAAWIGACLLCCAAMAQTPGRPMLGIAVGDLPRVAPVHGAVVRQVVPNSPASVAGLQPNDVIVAADGNATPDAAALTAYIGSRRAGDKVHLDIVRFGFGPATRLGVDATLGGAPAGAPAAADVPAPRSNEAAADVPGVAALSAPAGPSTTRVQWTDYTEPSEQAFTAQVPRGWHVAGRVARRAQIGPSPYLRLLSPDRRIYIVLGDPSLTLFTTPVRSPYARPAWQGQVVQDYVSSIPFAYDFATRTLAALCGDMKIEGQKDRPDLTQGRWAQANPNARHSGGEVSFACARSGVAMRGTVEVENYIYPSAGANLGGALWSVDLLAAYFAPPERTADAAAWMDHVIASMKINPAWARQEQAKEEAVVRGINAATEANTQVAKAAVAAAERKMHATLQQGEAFDRVITGNSPYADSVGNHYQLDNTKTQWLCSGGRTVGTMRDLSPGPGCEKLQEVPPE